MMTAGILPFAYASKKNSEGRLSSCSNQSVCLKVLWRHGLNVEFFIDRTGEVNRLGLFAMDRKHPLGLRLNILNIVHQLLPVRVTGKTFHRLDLHIDNDRSSFADRHFTPALLDTPAVGSSA